MNHSESHADDIIRITRIDPGFKTQIGDNWHNLELWPGNVSARWMSNDATIIVESNSDVSSHMALRALSFNEEREMMIYLNDQLVHKETIPTPQILTSSSEASKRISFPISLSKGINRIRFHGRPSPYPPADIVSLNSSDSRHLSVAFHNIRIYVHEDFNHLHYPRKLNLGSGFDIKTGYLNVDLRESYDPDLVADITNLSNLPSNMYERILAQDCLEHIPRGKVQSALSEWNRLLSKHGELQLRVPSLVDLLSLLKDSKSIEEQEWLIQCVYGTQAFHGDYHVSGFTHELLQKLLEFAGFTEIDFKLRDKWLFEVIAFKIE